MANSRSMMGFRFMCFAFKIRDLLSPRIHVLEEVGIRPGSVVLDYGCGCGSYILPLSSIIGSAGEIYALDIQRSAVQAVETLVAKMLTNNAGVSRATIYRTIDLLLEFGFINKLALIDGSYRYEHIMGHSNHEHLICEICGNSKKNTGINWMFIEYLNLLKNKIIGLQLVTNHCYRGI